MPIGSVNLRTGKNEMFGTVWDCWPESEGGACILVRDASAPSKFRVCFTSGRVESTALQFPVDSHMNIIHDQTRRRLGSWAGWNVVGVFPYTPQGLLDMRNRSCSNSLTFATFK